MTHKIKSRLLYSLRCENGQVLPMMAILMTGFFGMAAMTIDVGNVYSGYNELQSATNAAAMAGAEAIGNTSLTSPSVVAVDYGSGTGEYNAYPNLTSVVTTPNVGCSTAVTNMGISCITYNGSGKSTANAIQVTQTAKVRTYFAGMFGHPYTTISATATAARAGAASTPYNIAIVVDSTQSMRSNTDTNCSFGSMTRFQCALDSVQVLLQNLAPCWSSESSCGTSTYGITSPSVDRVALFTFPNLTTATMPDEYCAGGSKGTTCAAGGSNLVPEPYSYPSPSATSYTSLTEGSNTVSYLVTYASSGLGSDSNGYVSDYKTYNGTTTLNSSSDVVKAIGATSKSTADMYAQGGEGTYYAGAIYAAEASLYAEQQANPGSQNVLILISDGDATASSTQMASSDNGLTLSTTSGLYPSTKDECSQAVTAANGKPFTTARNSISRIYAVAYGAEASTCSGDTLSPCQTMQQIASSSNFFYSDYAQSGSGQDTGCVGTAATTTNLQQIFTDIASDFFSARLVPNSIFSS